jgi:hypothetical protein
MSPGSQPQESPESRLIGAGYSPNALGWLSPGGRAILSLEQALAGLPDPQPESVEAQPEESARSRAIAAGYAVSPLGWLAPGGQRVVSLEQALAEIEGNA